MNSIDKRQTTNCRISSNFYSAALLFGFWFLVFGFCLPASGQISPGKLSKYHEKLEGISNCTSCHELGKEISTAKCLDCHKPLQARITAGAGYHNSSEVKPNACASCHSEHNGREFELVHWKDGKDKFDHRLTGYPLEGAHQKAGCRNCHKPSFIADGDVLSNTSTNKEATYLGLGSACLNCHADEHGEQMNNDCATCHSFDAWKPAPKFAHAETKYPLTGKHIQVDCAKCHAWEFAAVADEGKISKKENLGQRAKYSGLMFSNCTPCHTDPHENKFGQDCQGCHTTTSFQQIVGKLFDHSKTNYPLVGKHARVDCAKCHKTGNMTEPLAHAQCSDCHHDAHHGQFANRTDKGKCESCHTVDGFLPPTYSLAQHQECRYVLTGSHLAVPCILCHAQVTVGNSTYSKYDMTDLTCKGCHKDPHEGQLDKWIAQGGCEYCHSTETWHRTTFDHKLSRFALEGKHRETACLACHTVKKIGTEQNVMWMKPIAIECASCHKDVHQGQFVRAELGETAADCRRCHTPQNWKDEIFVHNEHSRYKLDGAHAKVACAECHKPAMNDQNVSYVVYRPLGMECADCHGEKKKL